MKRILAITILILASKVLAEDIYVAQNAAGADNGTNAANAKSLAWLNTAANWGTGVAKVSPGDTVHLVGTLTSVFTPQGSGTAGNIITIFFEPGAGFSAPVWPVAGAIQLNDISYMTIDGGTDGYIRNTASGPTRTFQVPTRGIGGNGAGSTGAVSNFTIKNLRILEIYFKTAGMNNWDRLGYGIDLTAGSTGGSNVTIENCYVEQCDGLIGYTAGPGITSNLFIRNNTLRHYNHGLVLGVQNSNSILTNLEISGNNIDFSLTWDTTGDSPIHLDAIIILNNSYDLTSRIDNVRIHKNWFGPNVGSRTTAAIFNSLQGAHRQCENWYIYNNVFECANQQSYGQTYTWGNGFIAHAAENTWIFNNSLMGDNTGGPISAGGVPCHIYNNIVTSNAGVAFSAATSDTVSSSNSGANTQLILANYFADVWSDYNTFVGANPAFGFTLWMWPPTGAWWISGLLYPLSGWQTWYNNNRGMTPPIWNTTHADPHSTTIRPTFNSGTYVPTGADIQARGKGLNLTSVFTEMSTNWGSTIPATDYYGNARPSSGNWTIGAFEATAPTSTAPTLSSATINTAGNAIALVFNEAVQAGAGGSSGWTLSMTGGAVTVGSLTSGNGTTTLTYALTGRVIGNTETGTIAYTQPGNGIEDLTGGDDLVSLSGFIVTNIASGMKVAIPVFSLSGGPYFGTQNVTITSATSGATIRYTTNGSDPTIGSTLYTGAIAISTTTTLKAKAFATGMQDSDITTANYEIGTWTSSGVSWKTFTVPQQTGIFTWTFRASMNTAGGDGVIGLSPIPVTAYGDMSTILRFNASNAIDAYNNDVAGYAAVNAFTYTAGVTYQFVVTANVSTNKFSATVSTIPGTPVVIATNYAFRNASTELDNASIYAEIGAITASQMDFATSSGGGINTINVQNLRIGP